MIKFRSFQRDSRGPLSHTDLSVDQAVQKSFLTYEVELSHEKQWLEYLCLTRIIFEIHFLSSKSTLEANKCEELAVAWKWPPLPSSGPKSIGD